MLYLFCCVSRFCFIWFHWLTQDWPLHFLLSCDLRALHSKLFPLQAFLKERNKYRQQDKKKKRQGTLLLCSANSAYYYLTQINTQTAIQASPPSSFTLFIQIPFFLLIHHHPSRIHTNKSISQSSIIKWHCRKYTHTIPQSKSVDTLRESPYAVRQTDSIISPPF